jgi:FkbM family methyltransferase
VGLINRILSLPEFSAEPPVLVEVGASGGTHRPWRALAPYSICIAFDPDSRDLEVVRQEAGAYRRLYVFPAAAVAEEIDETDFHLTRSPYCSSLLEPDAQALADWDFARLFDVERTTRVPCVPLAKALREAGVSHVDWFKTDSQGVDLRLYQSLGDAICRRVLAAEFEPGIIDAYRGEDKLSAVLAAMDRPEFWLCDLRIRGTLRISPADVGRLAGGDSGRLSAAFHSSPGWGEMSYLNTFRGGTNFSKRDWLLGWVISSLFEQPGFALDLARRARGATGDAIFDDLAAETESSIRRSLRRGRTAYLFRKNAQRLRSLAARAWKRGFSSGRNSDQA